jgi:hypothetical protein
MSFELLVNTSSQIRCNFPHFRIFFRSEKVVGKIGQSFSKFGEGKINLMLQEYEKMGMSLEVLPDRNVCSLGRMTYPGRPTVGGGVDREFSVRGIEPGYAIVAYINKYDTYIILP